MIGKLTAVFGQDNSSKGKSPIFMDTETQLASKNISATATLGNDALIDPRLVKSTTAGILSTYQHLLISPAFRPPTPHTRSAAVHRSRTGG